MAKTPREFFYDLIQTPSPSGYEEKMTVGTNGREHWAASGWFSNLLAGRVRTKKPDASPCAYM